MGHAAGSPVVPTGRKSLKKGSLVRYEVQNNGKKERTDLLYFSDTDTILTQLILLQWYVFLYLSSQ
jgi:hypothetical protein